MRKFFPLLIFILVFYACKTPANVFIKKTAHEQYGEKLANAGLKQTAMGNKWFEVAQKAITNAVSVKLPFRENGYFASDRPNATGLRFDARRGELLTIELSKVPSSNYLLFADLFSYTNGTPKFIQSIDTVNNLIRYTVKENTDFILRLQPELLQSGSYRIVIQTGPSLAYPVPSPTSKNRIISFWGDGRDNGSRKHEGIDIGGVLRTPLVAVGNGRVSSVTENNLGGKVIFIRSAQGNESWYYAHLDSQIVTNGQQVKTGDIIGLMGNTGNAKTTAPHLHFGVYTMNGAIDPFPFVNPVRKEPMPVTAATNILGTQMRINGKSPQVYLSPDLSGKEKVNADLPVRVNAAIGNMYKIELPGGEIRFIAAANLVPIEKRLKQITLKQEETLTDAPIESSAVIQTLNAGSQVDLLGTYGRFQFVGSGDKSGWIVQ